MVRFLRKYWFSLILSVFVLLFFLFSALIVAAPHNDVKMRGFTPCTQQMAVDLNESAGQSKWQIIKVVNYGYVCYFGVIIEGVKLFVTHQQKTPWENYIFEPEIPVEISDDEDMEPFSEDLLQANLLDDKEKSTLEEDTQSKENDDEQN